MRANAATTSLGPVAADNCSCIICIPAIHGGHEGRAPTVLAPARITGGNHDLLESELQVRVDRLQGQPPLSPDSAQEVAEVITPHSLPCARLQVGYNEAIDRAPLKLDRLPGDQNPVGGRAHTGVHRCRNQ